LIELHRHAVHAVGQRAHLHHDPRACPARDDRQCAGDIGQSAQIRGERALAHMGQVPRDVPADAVDDFGFRGPVGLEVGDQLSDVIHGPDVTLQLFNAADLIRRLLLHHR